MSKRIAKISQIDSLRCIAAFMVIMTHYLALVNFRWLSFGAHGVQVFFVISGFLITSILLEQKDLAVKKTIIVKNFIIKRALRIFPIYYLVIILFSILSLCGLWAWNRGEGIYYYTYTTNILFYLQGTGGVQLNHVWSLAVEEQFYIVWPWLLLFFPKGKEWMLIVLVIALSLGYKMTSGNPNYGFLTISSFDTLGMGALLAYFVKTGKIASMKPLWLTKYLSWILILLIVLYFWVLNLNLAFSGKINDLVILCFSSLFVYGCYVGFKDWLGWILNLNFMKYLGKISYGLYLYHKFIPYFIQIAANKLKLHVNMYVEIVLSLGLTITVAHFSYNLIEKRFIKLKEKFDV